MISIHSHPPLIFVTPFLITPLHTFFHLKLGGKRVGPILEPNAVVVPFGTTFLFVFPFSLDNRRDIRLKKRFFWNTCLAHHYSCVTGMKM